MEGKLKLPGINEVIEQAISDRYLEVYHLKVLQNREYVEARCKVQELENKILSLLSGDLRELFDDFLDARSGEEYVSLKLCYRQGLIDGLGVIKSWRSPV